MADLKIFVPVLVLVAVIPVALAVLQSAPHSSSTAGRRPGRRRRRHDFGAPPAAPAFEAAMTNPAQIAANWLKTP